SAAGSPVASSLSLPDALPICLVLGHLTGGRVDVELVLGAVEDELQLPLPGRAVVIDLDLHQIAAADLLAGDLDRLLGGDRQLRRGQVGVRGQGLVPGSRGGPAAVGVPTAVGGRGAGSRVGGLLGGRAVAAAVGLRGAVALLGGAGAVGGRGGVRALVGGAAAPGDQGDGERPQGGRPGGAPSREDRGSHGFSTCPTESCRVGPRTPAGAGCPQARAPIAARREAENTLIPGSSAPTGRLGAGPRALPRPARRSYGDGVDPREMPWGTRSGKAP